MSALLVWGLNNWRWALPALIMGLMLGAIGVQTWRLERCHKGFAEYKVLAEAREKALGETINVQNRAVAALETESRNRMAKAQEGLRRATTEAQGARNEAARLRALATSTDRPVTLGECPAASAVQEIRRGLDTTGPR